MRTVSRLVLAAAMFSASAGMAGEASPPPQRPLLQPPVLQIPSPITDRFAVRVMYYRPSIATTVRYDDEQGTTAGTLISGEDTIGLPDTKNQAWLDLRFRLAPKHRIEAQYYQLKRTGGGTLTQPVDFGEDTFNPGQGDIISRADLRQLNIGYSYSLLRREQLELGLGLGIHLLQLTGSMEQPASFKREELDTAGPYPTLAADVAWRFTRRFSVTGGAHFLTFKHDGVKGRSLAWNADLQYRAHRNLAVGLGYASTLYRLDSNDPDFFSGYIRMKYQGPQLFVRAAY